MPATAPKPKMRRPCLSVMVEQYLFTHRESITTTAYDSQIALPECHTALLLTQSQMPMDGLHEGVVEIQALPALLQRLRGDTQEALALAPEQLLRDTRRDVDAAAGHR